MDTRAVGLALIGLALVLAILGLAVLSGVLGWFGHLPGDIRIESKSVHVYVPIVSMLLVSVVLTLVLSLIRRI